MCKPPPIVLSPPQCSLAHLGFFSGAHESGRHQRQAPATGVAAWDRASCSARSASSPPGDTHRVQHGTRRQQPGRPWGDYER